MIKAEDNITLKSNKELYDNAQYFWHTGTGLDTGAHITEIPKADFEADPANGGGNMLARSNAVIFRDGLDELAKFGASGMRIGKTTEKNIEITSTDFNVYDEDGSIPFSVSTDNSLKTYTHGFGINLKPSGGSYYEHISNVFLKGSLTDNRVYFAVSTSGYPTTFTNYVTLPASPATYPSAQTQITIDGVECKARWEAPSTIRIDFRNTSSGARFPAMQITEQYYETWIKANDAQLSVNYSRLGLVDTKGVSDIATTFARTYGHIATIALGVYNTSSIARYQTIYTGTLMNLVPAIPTALVGTYQGETVTGQIASNGAIAVTNTTSSAVTSSASQPIILYATYIFQ